LERGSDGVDEGDALMAPRITVPLFVTCERCGGLKQVPTRSRQARQRFCSFHCARKATAVMNIPREAQSRGGKMRASRCRARLMAAVARLTPMEAFRLGYTRGMQSKNRQLAKRRAA
jgi:hypothetical protein